MSSQVFESFSSWNPGSQVHWAPNGPWIHPWLQPPLFAWQSSSSNKTKNDKERDRIAVWEVHQQHTATFNNCFTRAAVVLTAEGRLVSSIGAVSLAITHLSLCDAHLVCGTQPLTWWAAEWWCGTVCFIAHIPAVIIPITNPALRHTVSISTLELYRTAGMGWAAIVLIRAVLTVWMAITFPHFRNAKSVDLALELIVMAQTWPTCGCTWNTSY